jgi:hypothetical protein
MTGDFGAFENPAIVSRRSRRPDARVSGREMSTVSGDKSEMPTVFGILIHPMTPPLVENVSQNATCGAISPAAQVRRTFAPSRPSSRCTFRPIRSADRARRTASVQRSSLEDWVPAQDAHRPPIAVKPAAPTQDDIDLLCVGPTLSTAEAMMQQGGIAFSAGSQFVARESSQGRAFGTTSTAASWASTQVSSAMAMSRPSFSARGYSACGSSFSPEPYGPDELERLPTHLADDVKIEALINARPDGIASTTPTDLRRRRSPQMPLIGRISSYASSTSVRARSSAAFSGAKDVVPNEAQPLPKSKSLTCIRRHVEGHAEECQIKHQVPDAEAKSLQRLGGESRLLASATWRCGRSLSARPASRSSLGHSFSPPPEPAQRSQRSPSFHSKSPPPQRPAFPASFDLNLHGEHLHEEVLAAHAALRSRNPMSAPQAIRGGVKRTRSESELAMGSRCPSAPRLHTPPAQPTPSHMWFQPVDAAVRVQLANSRQPRASPQAIRGGVKRTRSESELAMASRCPSAPRLHTPPAQPTPSHMWFQPVDAAVRVQLAFGRQPRASPQPTRCSPAASPLIPFCFANGRQPRASHEPQEASACAFGSNDEPYDDILAVASQLRMGDRTGSPARRGCAPQSDCVGGLTGLEHASKA